MPTDRQTPVIPLRIVLPEDFRYTLTDVLLRAIRGGSTVSLTVEWIQGVPIIPNISLTTFSLLFYNYDSAGETLGTQIQPSDSNYNIGDQTLADIVTLTNFVDDGDGTGAFDINVDPSGITDVELTAELNTVAVKVTASQPDPGEEM